MNFVLAIEESIDDGCGDSFTTEKLIFIEGNSFDEINNIIKRSAVQAYKNNMSSFVLNTESQSVDVEVFNFMQMKKNKIEYKSKLFYLDDFFQQRSLKLRVD